MICLIGLLLCGRYFWKAWKFVNICVVLTYDKHAKGIFGGSSNI